MTGIARRAASFVGRVRLAISGVLVRAAVRLGTPREVTRALVLAYGGRTADLNEVGETLASRATLTPAEIVGNHLRGYVLLSRWTAARGSQPWFRYIAPRAVITLESSRVPDRIARYARHSELEISLSAPLDEVMKKCSERERTWIVEPVSSAWRAVGAAGLGRACGAYLDGVLVAGLWGMLIGRTFTIMSLFHHENRAGAILMAHVVGSIGGDWDVIDCGELLPRTARFGAYEVPTDEFLDGLLGRLAAGTSS